MTDFRPLPDVEALTIGYLLADVDVTALADDRIEPELPVSFPDGARVRILRVGGAPVDAGTERLDRPLLQIETYGTTKAEAWDLTAVVLMALQRMADAAHAGAVVTACDRVTGPRWAPDPSTDTPRYLTDVAVYVHAA